jgi:amidohydrolase
MENISTAVQQQLPHAIALRRQLHQHPECSGDESKTAATIRTCLEQHGITCHSNIGGHGILATIKCANPQASWVALRADMDALPIDETGQTNYKSTVRNVSHCCGHDAHSAMLVSAAIVLQQMRTSLTHHIACIFQPAEEKATGAQAMIEDGLFRDFTPQRIHALHVSPHLPAGHIGIKKGVMCAATDLFEVTVTGQGGHAARPHQCSDVILAASHIMQSINQIISRRVDANHQAVLSIGRFQSGFAANVMPEQAMFAGTIRSLHPEVHQQIRQSIQNMSQHIAEAWRVDATFKLQCSIPLLRNDDHVIQEVRQALNKVLASELLIELSEASMGGEDFAAFLAIAPGCLLRLGTASSSATSWPLHHPAFDLDEQSMHHGIMALVTMATY